ncbi:MAG: hypothetical protein OMM_07374 [Candidatus Magnetoglobus multicellularis str. Araruama]|uniref:Uncharacterized protein n=1 Tax=Candidatus Magnetoglobus multicellularis str. Araruama TaxID=890399 RepID=A0A1V1PCX6_9BACT|nr:MAG: hypothetical protein OMM_07374 [Candidatus Magnetoglobus multicellularis str. Araruama]
MTIRGALSTEYQNHLILDHGQQLSVDATIALNGNFLEKGSGTVDWSGSLLGTGEITFNQPITLKGDTTWRSSDGQINIFQTIDGPHTVNVNAGTGSVQFAQDIGKTSPLTAIDVVSGILDTKEIHTSNLGIHINAETIQLNGDISTLQGPVVFDGNVSIMSDLRMETSGGHVDFNGQLTDSDSNRTLHMATADGSISLQNINMGAVNFESGGDLILNDNITVKQEWHTKALANIELKNDITIQTQNSDIQMSNAIDGHHALILNTGIEHIGNIHISSNMGETEALKSLSIQDAGACYIDGNIVTANGDVMFMPSVMLTRNLAINTGTGIGNIHFLDKIFSTDEHSYNLDLMSGGGDIHFIKDVGPNTPLGRISIEKARSIYVHSSFHANEISMTPFQSLKLGGSMTATNGNLIINGNLQTTQNQLHLQTLNGNISISGKISDSDNTHTLTLNANTGQLNINDVSLGELTIAAADQGLQLSGEITVNDRFDTSNIAGSIGLKNHTAIRTRNTGDIVFTPTIDGPFNLLVDSKNGTVRINQSIGKTHRVQSFTIHSSESVMLADDILVSSGEIVIPGNISLLTDNITLDSIIGDIVLNGKLADNDNDYQLNIKASAGNIYLWELDLAGIQLSAPNKGLYLNGDIQVKNPFDTSEIVGPITIETPLSIKTESQDVVLKTNITLNGDLNINTGSEGGDIKIHGEINGRHAVSVAAGTGNIAFTKDIGNTDAVASVSVISGNTLSLKNVTAHGNIHMDNNHSINLHGNLQTLDAGSDIVVNNADIKMDGTRSIATNNGNIVLDAISPIKNDTQKLVLYAGEGNISIDQAIGQAELAFAEIDIMGATDIHLMGAETTVHAKSLQIASMGGLRMDGKITLSGTLNLNVNLLQINASIETNGDISIANSSGAIIDGNIQSGSQIHFTGPGKIDLGGDILAEKSVRIDQSVLSLKSTHYIRSQTDEIVLHGISTETPGENIIQLNAGKDITIKGPVGRSDQVMGGIHVVNARNLSFANTDETLYANTMTIQSVSNDTSFHGKICIFGDLNIDTKTMTILDSIETQNSGNISIITKDAVTMGSTITAGGKIHWQQQSDLMINDKLTATGSITFAGSGNIHLNADISITGNGANLIIDQSTLIVKGDHQLSTFNGDIKLKQIQTNTADDHVLTVSSENGNIDILDNVGSNTERMGGLVISDANKVAFSGQNASINVNTLNINNKDTLTIQSDIQSIGDLTFKGAGNILLGADLEVTGQDSNISILYSTVQLMSGCAIISHHGDIQLSDIIPQTNDAADLKLDASDNQIFFNGDTGRSGKALSGLDIVQADQVHVNGNIHISGDININARLLTVDKPIDAIDNGTIKMAITEEASINDKVTSDGNIEFQSTGKLVLNSTIETRQPASSIDIKAPLVLSKHSRIDTHGGDINLSDISSVSEESMLIMGSGQGNIAFNGSIGDITQSVSDIQITSAKDISFQSTATAIYTDQLRIENKKGQTLIDAPLYVNADVMLTSATLTINADIHFSANANLTIITSGQTFLNADLQVPGNILFDGKGDIQLSGNLETTVPGKSIKAPDAAIIVSGNRSLTTQAGNIELAQISGDEITLNPAGANVEISGSVGTSDAPIAGINIVNAQDVAFISEHAKIYAADHLNIGAAGSAVFNGDIAADNNMDINAKTLTIASHLNISKDVKFDIHGDISIMGIETNNQGNITLISQTGKISLGRMNAGANGNIDLQAQQGIDGDSLIGNSVSIKAATIGAQIPPILDTQNFSATLTGVPGSAFAGHIKMASAGASLPKSSQINYLGTGLSLFVVEGMTVYGVDASDKSFYPMPVTDYEQHGLMRNAYMANRPEFFMIPPLNVDISIEADAEIEFLQMDYEM